MDFRPSPAQQILISTARAFLRQHCPPELAQRLAADERGFDETLWRRMAELGWPGLLIPPELFKFYLEVEGFTDVNVRTFEPSEKRLNEAVPEGPIRDNVKLLNETLFGDRDYAVVGRAPS